MLSYTAPHKISIYIFQVQEGNAGEYKDKTKEVAHKVKHYGAFGEEYLGEQQNIINSFVINFIIGAFWREISR